MKYSGHGGCCSARSPIVLDGRINPRLSNLTLYNDVHNAIELMANTYSQNVTLDIVDKPYIILGSLTIASSYSLLIKPGVIIKTDVGKNDINISGALNAIGKPDSLITFTSIKDDSSGNNDSNGDGPSIASVGDWGGIILNNSPMGAQTIMNNCLIKYTGTGGCCWPYTPILLDGRINPTIQNLSLYNNLYNGIELMAQNYTQNIEINITSVPIILRNGFSINSGSICTIDAGVIFKCESGVVITINGVLKSQGNLADHVIFTSIKDDLHGGDSNANGTSYGSGGDWGGITFGGTCIDSLCILTNTEFLYGGGSGSTGNSLVSFTDAAAKIEFCTFSTSSNHGIRCYNTAGPDVGGGNFGSHGFNKFIAFSSPNNYGIFNDGSGNIQALHNCWGSTDTNQIKQIIYDFNNNAGKGRVYYNPFNISCDTTSIPTMIPTKPLNLMASVTLSSVALSWTASGNIPAGYYVYSSTDHGNTFTKIGSTTTNAFSDTGLTAYSSHWYYITAYNIMGNSPPSDVVETMTAPANITIPIILGVPDTGANSMRLRWSRVSTASLYHVYARRSIDPSFQLSGSFSDSIGTIQNLTALTQYVVRVSALNSGGESSLSDSIVVTTKSSNIDVNIVDGNPALLGIPYDQNGYPDPSTIKNKFDPPNANWNVSGTCADGVSNLIIVLRTTSLPGPVGIVVSDDQGTNNSIVAGQLGRLNQSLGGATLQLTNSDFLLTTSGIFEALVVYAPPIDFVRQFVPTDTTIRERIIHIQITNNSIVTDKTIQLYRPPLVLAHGLWEDQSIWDSFKLPVPYNLDNSIRFDYKSTSGSYFSTNTVLLENFIDTVLCYVRKSALIACTQIDIIGHSMGGILPRLVSQDASFSQTKSSFYKGYFHKLITMDTPHFGTKFANYLFQNKIPDSMTDPLLTRCRDIQPIIVSVLWASKHFVDQGAVQDLQDQESGILSIKPTLVPSHPIYAYPYSDLDYWKDHNLAVIYLMMSTMGNPQGHVFTFSSISNGFLGQNNDMIVSSFSQTAGLSGRLVSLIDFNVHNSVYKDPRISDTVKYLLNASAVNTSLFSNLQSAPTSSPSTIISKQHPLRQDIGVSLLPPTFATHIASPDSTFVPYPGSEFTLKLSVQDSTRLKYVFYAAPGLLVADSTRSLTRSILIPYDFVGKYILYVIATDTSGNYGIDSLRYALTPTSSLVAISISPESLQIYKSSPSFGLTIQGTYSDSSHRNLTGLTGINFQSNDTSVVKVDSIGNITPMNAGRTFVKALYNGLKDSIAITVTDNNSVSLISPLNGSTGFQIPGIFVWNKINNSLQYQVDVSRYNDFSSYIFSDSTFSDSTTTIPSLRVVTHYFWRVRAKVRGIWQPYSATWLFKTKGPDIAHANGWNMLSNPVVISDSRKTTLFPLAVSQAFSYKKGYIPVDSMNNGKGYWLKFNGDGNSSMTGDFLPTDTISVTRGWNMIGSISLPVLTTSITSNTVGLTMSPLYGYAGGYYSADTINPGKAYWVKVNEDGVIILNAPSGMMAPKNNVRIVPTSEMPPPPPDEQEKILELPKEYSLAQNYPNPFNPVTIIHYALPVDSKVTLKIFNVLGQEVKALADKIESAGTRSADWDATNIASGVYFYRLDATAVNDPGKHFSQVRKMLVIK
ncbi:MAG: T9SS type A sorting domain-containing protein [Bacteroidota bacterium]